MKILYIGDIMGRPGRDVVKRLLPELQRQYAVDFTVAQAENVSGGKGLRVKHMRELQKAGVDAFTGGNHTFAREEIYPLLNDLTEPIVRPANYPQGAPGKGWKFVSTTQGEILVISLLGQIVGKDANVPVDNPLHVIDAILNETKLTPKAGIIVNFHGDYSSEKVVIGQYLDGKASAVIGDHWHIPTADAQVLPGGTAHISDVGMVGARHASLGIKKDIIIERWHSGKLSRNRLETHGPYQFCAVLLDINTNTGRAKSIEQIIKYIS